jgi:hypothetical protein
MVIFYGDKNNNNQIDFRFDNQKKIQFNGCAGHVLIDGNLLFFYDIYKEKPRYRNGIYEVYWDDSTFTWLYDEIGVATRGTSLSDVYYPWLAIWIPASLKVEEYCF